MRIANNNNILLHVEKDLCTSCQDQSLVNCGGSCSYSMAFIVIGCYCNIPTFEALLRKYKYLFLERCRISNNVWLRALMQSDFLYSSLLFKHYNRILLCDWVIELCRVRLIDGVSCHIAFAVYLD